MWIKYIYAKLLPLCNIQGIGSIIIQGMADLKIQLSGEGILRNHEARIQSHT